MFILQFVDNTLFFMNTDTERMQNLGSILLLFVGASGLKMNLCKSKILGVGECSNLRDLADILGCQVASFPEIIFILGCFIYKGTLTIGKLRAWLRFYLNLRELRWEGRKRRAKGFGLMSFVGSFQWPPFVC